MEEQESNQERTDLHTDHSSPPGEDKVGNYFNDNVGEEDWENESEDEPCRDTCTFSSQNDTPLVSYNLKLICSTDDTKSRNTKIVIPHTPRTVLDVKLCVENEFSIPACCQCITFESHKLRDQDSIEELRIREGDKLTVNYTSEAMVEDIREIIQAMKAMRHFLRRKDIRKQLTKGCENDREFANDIDGQLIDMMTSTYFSPAEEEQCKANLMFFVNNNGLFLVSQLHEELLKYPLKNCTLELYALECAILGLYWHITLVLSNEVLVHFFKQPKLEAMIKSLVRVKISPDSDIQGPRHESHGIIAEVLFQAAGTIACLAEIPKYQMMIASRKDVLDQLLALLTCPSYNSYSSTVAVCGILALSFSPETHPYLITSNTVEKFENSYSISEHRPFSNEQHLKYLQSLFYAHLLHASASRIPLHNIHQMCKAIKNVLETTTFLQIHNHEKKDGFIWTTIIPFLKLAYLPEQNPQGEFCTVQSLDINYTKSLQELCAEIGVFSLQSILLSEENRKVLIAESLTDYLVCLTWHLSPETEAYRRACDLKSFLSLKMQLQPPSLVSLTKAKLAATHCGLEKVFKATSLHDIVDVAMCSI